MYLNYTTEFVDNSWNVGDSTISKQIWGVLEHPEQFVRWLTTHQDLDRPFAVCQSATWCPIARFLAYHFQGWAIGVSGISVSVSNSDGYGGITAPTWVRQFVNAVDSRGKDQKRITARECLRILGQQIPEVSDEDQLLCRLHSTTERAADAVRASAA